MGNLKADSGHVLRIQDFYQADPESIVFEHVRVLVNPARIVKTSRETIIATP